MAIDNATAASSGQYHVFIGGASYDLQSLPHDKCLELFLQAAGEGNVEALKTCIASRRVSIGSVAGVPLSGGAAFIRGNALAQAILTPKLSSAPSRGWNEKTVQTVSYLISEKCPVNDFQSYDGTTPLHYLLKTIEEQDLSVGDGAARPIEQKCAWRMMNLLLDGGADPAVLDGNGNSLVETVQRSSLQERTRNLIMQHLLRREPALVAKTVTVYNQDQAARSFIHAVMSRNEVAIAAALERDFVINRNVIINGAPITPLEVVALRRRSDLVEPLLAMSQRIGTPVDYMEVALTFAATQDVASISPLLGRLTVEQLLNSELAGPLGVLEPLQAWQMLLLLCPAPTVARGIKDKVQAHLTEKTYGDFTFLQLIAAGDTQVQDLWKEMYQHMLESMPPDIRLLPQLVNKLLTAYREQTPRKISLEELFRPFINGASSSELILYQTLYNQMNINDGKSLAEKIHTLRTQYWIFLVADDLAAGNNRRFNGVLEVLNGS